MKFKILEGDPKILENNLNMLSQEYDIDIKGVSSSPVDLQLGTGGAVIVFTMTKKEIKKTKETKEIKKPKKVKKDKK